MPNPASQDVRDSIDEATDSEDPNDSSRKWLVKPPNLRYFIRELRGQHHLNSKLIYASDGGHYENLGLVELVRRKCTEVWCIDASGDPAGSAITLAESLTLITSELGHTIDLDLSKFEISPEPAKLDYPIIRRTFATGRIDSSDGDYTCQIHVVKIGLDSDTSPRIAMLRQRHRRFPYDSTSDQLYTASRFDLYRDLGFDSTDRAISELQANSTPNGWLARLFN